MKVTPWLLLLAAVVVAALVGFVRLGPGPQPAQRPLDPAESAPAVVDTGCPILPIPTGGDLDERVVELGRRLFHEERLSADGTIACASCHSLETGGTDGRSVSIGIGGAKGDRNAPTVLNSSLNFRQFWDGRMATLEEQAGGPLTHPKEMGSTWEAALAFLRGEPSYASAFVECYPDGISEANVRNAIATFERSLLTPGSRFDRYLTGESDALTEDEKSGWELFQKIGCITCHQGVNMGGNLYQRFGIASNFFEDRGRVTDSDLGRFAQTQRDTDAFKFKVPSLRNISRTGPYFHDGSVPTLEQAVRIMAQYQLGQQITDGEVRLLAAFLRSLEGNLDGTSGD